METGQFHLTTAAREPTRVPDWLWLLFIWPVASVGGMVYVGISLYVSPAGAAAVIVLIYGCVFSLVVGFAATIGGMVLSAVVPSRLFDGWASVLLSSLGTGAAGAAVYDAIFGSADAGFHSIAIRGLIAFLGFVLCLVINLLARAGRKRADRRRAAREVIVDPRSVLL